MHPMACGLERNQAWVCCLVSRVIWGGINYSISPCSLWLDDELLIGIIQMNKQELVQNIKDAFSAIEVSKNERLFIPSADHIFDAQRAEAKIREVQWWWEIPLDVLIANRDRISYLSKDGFRFLLPAFLIAAIEQPKQVDVLVSNIIWTLTPPKTSDIDKYKNFETRMAALSIQQSQVIANFFQEYTTIYPVDEWSFTESDEVKISRAYVFWRSKAQQAE